MRLSVVLLLLLSTLIASQPIQAESQDCLADLDKATEMLREAQQQASNGQLDKALETASAANALLDEIRLRCATAQAEVPTEDFAVTTRAVKFSVSYPKDWTPIALRNGIPLASELMTGDGLPTVIFQDAQASGFDARQIMVIVGDPNRLASTFLRSEEALFTGMTNPAFMLKSLVTAALKNMAYRSEAQPSSADEVESFVINTAPAAAVTFNAGRNTGAIVLIKLPNEQFGLLMGVGNAEGKRNTPEILRALCLLMAGTLTVDA